MVKVAVVLSLEVHDDVTLSRLKDFAEDVSGQRAASGMDVHEQYQGIRVVEHHISFPK